MQHTRMKVRWVGLLGALALLLAGTQLFCWASDDDDDGPYTSNNPISGTVVQISWRGDDLFVQLDVNGDGTGDLWVKIKHEAQIVDPQGNPLGFDAIQVGVQLTITQYKYEHNYYEAYRVVVGQGSSGSGQTAGQKPIQGKVVRAFKFGDDFFVTLDTDGDEKEDLKAKIKKNARIVDPQGNPLGFDAIRPGVTLTLVAYKLDDDGYYETWHVIVGKAAVAAPPQAGQPLEGTVLEVLAIEDDLFVRLDADGDGFKDYDVKISRSTVLVDPQGNPLGFDAIQVGVRLTVTDYEFKAEDGYYEAKRVVVGP